MTEFMRNDRMKDSAIKLNNVHTDASIKYFDKEQEKGDSWRDMSINKMISIMEKEIEEFNQARKNEYRSKTFTQKESYQEILDIINTAKMVGALMKEFENNG